MVLLGDVLSLPLLLVSLTVGHLRSRTLWAELREKIFTWNPPELDDIERYYWMNGPFYKTFFLTLVDVPCTLIVMVLILPGYFRNRELNETWLAQVWRRPHLADIQGPHYFQIAFSARGPLWETLFLTLFDLTLGLPFLLIAVAGRWRNKTLRRKGSSSFKRHRQVLLYGHRFWRTFRLIIGDVFHFFFIIMALLLGVFGREAPLREAIYKEIFSGQSSRTDTCYFALVWFTIFQCIADVFFTFLSCPLSFSFPTAPVAWNRKSWAYGREQAVLLPGVLKEKLRRFLSHSSSVDAVLGSLDLLSYSRLLVAYELLAKRLPCTVLRIWGEFEL